MFRTSNAHTALEIAAARKVIADGSALQLRQSAGLSRAEVAAELGVAPNTVRRWEAGEVRPGGTAAVEYLRILRALADRPGVPSVAELPR